MLEDKTIEWQGNLRKTYDKYLNPAVLDYDNQEMWEMADNGTISSLFQLTILSWSKKSLIAGKPLELKLLQQN